MTEYLILQRQDQVARNGKPYVNLRVRNVQEAFPLTVWDCAPTSGPKPGQVALFGPIKDQDGKKSIDSSYVSNIKDLTESHPFWNLMPHPTKREDWEQCIRQLLSFCTDPKLTPIIERYGLGLYDRYIDFPAATSVHHAFPGGLVTHTYQMLRMLEGLFPVLPYPIKVERCILAILFHDFGKRQEYNREGTPQEDMFLMGHIFLSAHNLYNYLLAEGVDETEIKRIVHCVLAHHGQKEYGSPVTPCTQEAIIVSMVDDLSAKTDCVEQAGNLERVFALDTHVIKS